MPHNGSMTTGDLVAVLKRSNPHIRAVCSRMASYRNVGLYVGDLHIAGITQCGSLPPRTIKDDRDVIVCRGWRDIVAKLYWNGHLYKNSELVRLMGRNALEFIDRTNNPDVPQSIDVSGRPYIKYEGKDPEWMRTLQSQ